MKEMTTKRNVQNQSIAAIVTEQNVKNAVELTKKLHQIDFQTESELSMITERLGEALGYVQKVRDFVGTPEHILGSQTTKHGEIAEQVNVNFRNAERVLEGKIPDATFEGVGRTAPEDFLVNGVAVQSKYINGANNSLTHVIDHLNKYESIGFGRNDSYYIIPKDQYEMIQKVLVGDNSGLSPKTINAIIDKAKEIERLTGKTFTEAVKSGNVNYAEVQQGAIHKTIAKEEHSLVNKADAKKEQANRLNEREKAKANAEAAPSWSKAAKAAGSAAAFSGTFTLAVGIFKKCENGIKINEFSVDDWKELGLDTAKAAAEGGITGFALYGLTNFTSISAPIGAAGISLAFGVADLAYMRYQGTISDGEFYDGCKITAINSAVSAFGAFIGQELIPVPLLGAVIGSFIAGKALEELCGDGFERAVKDATVSVLNSERNIERLLVSYRNSFHASNAIQHTIQTRMKHIEEKEVALDKSIRDLQTMVEDL